jgi:uncharacterized protein (TIGR03437 family)
MKTPTKLLLTSGVAFSVATVLYAFSFGPDAHYTGVPGTGERTCVFCHAGTPLNGGGGNVSVKFPDGLVYTPGQKQTLTITITDSQARVYGFEMTARLMTNLSGGQAGTFTPASQQQVKCASSSVGDTGSPRQGSSCPSAQPLEFIEHNSPYTTKTITVDWTPPAVASGQIGIYISANAANGDGNLTGDHIYNTAYTLNPAASQTDAPTIAGIASAGAFSQAAGLASGTWLEIFGQHLSTTSREWAGSDFHGNDAPTSLDGVSVTINGKPAFVRLISPGQVNVLAPDDSAIGDGIPVVLKNSAGSSAPLNLHKSAIAPAFLAPPSFKAKGKQYVAALFADGRFVGDKSIISHAERPAKPGDIVVIYAIGCGPVTPATPAGVIATQANSVQNKPVFLFGQTPATLLYDGLTPGFVGLYQFNVRVPNVGSGDVPLNVSFGGTTVNQSLFITVGE